jgi:hypothetical protein
MGNYVYALRSPKLNRVVTIQQDNGNVFTVEVASMSYLYKPHYSFSSRNLDNWTNAVFTKLQNSWEKKIKPSYVAFTEDTKKHKIEIGQNIYQFKKGFIPYAYCDGEEDLIRIGKIIQVFD